MIHIACAADELYAPYCAAMLRSLFMQHPTGTITVHFLHSPNFSLDAQSRFKQLAQNHGQLLRLHQIPDAAVADLPEMQRIPRLMWYRVLLPDLLPELDRILYLDADTLVTDHLDALWETDLDGFEVAAVANVIEAAFQHRPGELGLPAGSHYFNSGVLLFNLSAMRDKHSAQRILDFARREALRLLWPDQDALNVVLAQHCRWLHPRWNCQNTLYYWTEAREIFGSDVVAEAIAAPAILHFEGPAQAKPWHYLNDHPFRNRYLEHMHATTFAAPKLTGHTLKNIVRRYLPRCLWNGLRFIVRKCTPGRR